MERIARFKSTVLVIVLASIMLIILSAGKAYAEEPKWDGVSYWKPDSTVSIDYTYKYGDSDCSIKIDNPIYNDYGVYFNFEVKPKTPYKASVMVRYDGYKLAPDKNQASGGGLGLYGDPYTYSKPYSGSEWKKVEMEFVTGNETTCGIMLKNGYGSRDCKGTAYFCNLTLEEVIPQEKLTLIHGSSTLKDENAYVITICAEGFTKSQQDLFIKKAKAFSAELFKVSPWKEMKSMIKIYAIGSVSKQSGCKGDKATTAAEAKKDKRDTAFGAYYWASNIERLLAVGDSSKVKHVVNMHVPDTDVTFVLVNSSKYGGWAGGEIISASTNSSSAQIALHEMGHTVAGLADEYNYGETNDFDEKPNRTRESDITKVKWKKFVGRNGIGLTKYENTKGWYIPSEYCKMRYHDRPYCEVCKEAIREAVCKNTTKSMIYFQPYNKKVRIGSKKFDIRKYVVVRKGEKTISGAKVASKITVTYYNSKNKKMSSAPKKAGTYYAKVSFKGNSSFGACKQKFKFKIYK